MARTILESATKSAIIGFDSPFCIIGERINPTGRKKMAEEIQAGNFDMVHADALAQVAAGAHVIDVNAGVSAVNPNETEPALLVEMIKVIQETVDVPLCIDSSVSAAIEAALSVCKGRPLINSTTGEEEKMEVILPLCGKYKLPVVAVSNDEEGISEDPDVRFNVAKKIVQRAADYGIPAHDVVVDPLVMPIGAMKTAGLQVFALVRRLRDELGVNTTCGASNVSFGIPNRHGINAAFIPMAISNGLTSAIMNPLRPQEIEAVKAANVLMGTDQDCMDWIRTYREPSAGQEAGEGRRRRRRG